MLAGTRVPQECFGHNVRRPTQFVCRNSDSVCPNSDKIYLMVVTFRFLLLFFAYQREARLISPWIALFWLPAETLSLLPGKIDSHDAEQRKTGPITLDRDEVIISPHNLRCVGGSGLRFCGRMDTYQYFILFASVSGASLVECISIRGHSLLHR